MGELEWQQAALTGKLGNPRALRDERLHCSACSRKAPGREHGCLRVLQEGWRVACVQERVAEMDATAPAHELAQQWRQIGRQQLRIGPELSCDAGCGLHGCSPPRRADAREHQGLLEPGRLVAQELLIFATAGLVQQEAEHITQQVVRQGICKPGPSSDDCVHQLAGC